MKYKIIYKKYNTNLVIQKMKIEKVAAKFSGLIDKFEK